MKRKSEYYPLFKDEGELIASWGEARLIEYLDGKLIVPPGVGWVPMFSAAGTNCLLGWSLTWREVSI